MSKWEKLLNRIYSMPKDVRFAELQKILETYGYVMQQSGKGSSHYVFRKAGYPPVTIPKSEPIKRPYVESVRDVILREEGFNDED